MALHHHRDRAYADFFGQRSAAGVQDRSLEGYGPQNNMQSTRLLSNVVVGLERKDKSKEKKKCLCDCMCHLCVCEHGTVCLRKCVSHLCGVVCVLCM